jgi:glutaredoxin
MKKNKKKVIIISAICAVLFIGLVVVLLALASKSDKKDLPKKTDHEKVSIYIFRGDGCSHCHDAISYLYNNINPYKDYIEVKTYEVWKDVHNKMLFDSVIQKFGKEKSGVPFIVIGDAYYFEGYADNGNDFIKTALEEYQNDEYKDIVKETIEENKYENLKMTTLKEAAIEEKIASEGNGLFAMLGVFAAVIIGVGIFLIVTKEN